MEMKNNLGTCHKVNGWVTPEDCNMGKWWEDAAADLRDRVRKVDEEEVYKIDYSEEEVRRAIVHTRQDVVMLVSHLGSISK